MFLGIDVLLTLLFNYNIDRPMTVNDNSYAIVTSKIPKFDR